MIFSTRRLAFLKVEVLGAVRFTEKEREQLLEASRREAGID